MICKKLLLLCFLGLGNFGLFAQVSTEPSEDIDPEDSLKIIIDISKLDATKDYVQNLQAEASAGKDLYFWTWSPFEFPAGHPKTNGTGAQAWKNSNDLLKLTKEKENVYSYKMVPTLFYEVDAATVYDKDIMFLVKPKDGGGYGDPDAKSDDLKVAIDPPKLERDPAYAFPEAGQPDDVFTIYYDNSQEKKVSMQNLSENECYLYAEATLSDSTIIKVAPNFFTVGTYPELKLDYIGNNTFRKFVYANELFTIPQGKTITAMKFVIIREVYLSGKDRLDYDIPIDLSCK